MKTKEDEKYNQSRRILHIYRLFLLNRVMTSKEVISEIKERFPAFSDRSILRDMRILSDEGFIETNKKGRASTWKICYNKEIIGMPLKLKESELLSFYILKSYLKTFTGTSIEKDFQHLEEILETYAPGTVIMEEQFYGDQNIGYYDYSTKNETIRLCIKHINEKNWIKIKYERLSDAKVQDYLLFPNFLYTYAGTIYLVAYNPKRKKTTNFAVQNIISIDEYYGKTAKAPNFDYSVFRNQRFAVVDSEIREVKLMIKKEYVKYFENRDWHPSQKLKFNSDGTLIISLNVPLSQEFISWICHWHEGIKVLEPKDLVESVIKLLRNTINNYS